MTDRSLVFQLRFCSGFSNFPTSFTSFPFLLPPPLTDLMPIEVSKRLHDRPRVVKHLVPVYVLCMNREFFFGSAPVPAPPVT